MKHATLLQGEQEDETDEIVLVLSRKELRGWYSALERAEQSMNKRNAAQIRRIREKLGCVAAW